jgi:hypothetical protein
MFDRGSREEGTGGRISNENAPEADEPTSS